MTWYCWYQWQLNQQSPPLSLMTTLRLPLRIGSPCSQLLSPFGINGKGNILWQYSSPSRHAHPVNNLSLFLKQLFFVFASMAMSTSFGNTAPPIISHCWYFDELLFYHKDTVVDLNSFAGNQVHLIVFNIVLGFSQNFHYLCFVQWGNLPTFLSIL